MKTTVPDATGDCCQNDEFCPTPHRIKLMTPDSYSVPMPEIIHDGPAGNDPDMHEDGPEDAFDGPTTKRTNP